MKCSVCKKAFKNGEQLVPISLWIEGHRGGFAGNGDRYVHLAHLKNIDPPALVVSTPYPAAGPVDSTIYAKEVLRGIRSTP